MNRGFTLIELIVVMGIMGTLIGIGISSYTSSISKSRDARRKSDLKQIQVALEKYKEVNGTYPKTSWVNSASATSNKSPWIPDFTSDYITTLPTDPKNVVAQQPGAPDQAGNFVYAYYSDDGLCGLNGGYYYILATRLENLSDHDAGQTLLTSSCKWPASFEEGIYALSNP